MEQSNRLEALVTKYENTLFRAALAILADPHEAQDAVQDAYVKFLEKQPQFQDGEHARAWLLKVTANGCKSRLRARKRHPVAELLDTYPAPEGDSRELVEAILGQRPGTVRSHLSRAREALRTYLKGEEP